MSRVIKFRGYSYAKQSWLYGNLIEKDDPQIEKPTPWVRLIHNRALDAEMVVFGSVGQFTGLHDKNRDDVFEDSDLDDELVPEPPSRKAIAIGAIITLAVLVAALKLWNVFQRP